MTHSVKISGNILRWVLTQVQPEALSPKVTAHLNNWVRGEATPTFEEIEETSRATGIPLGYFFLKEPPAEDLSFLAWRTVDSEKPTKPSRPLIDTIHHMGLVQDWMHNQMLADEAARLPFIGAGKGETDPLRLAELIRNVLDLTPDWFLASANARESFDYLREAMSCIGVIVMTSETVTDDPQRPLNINEFQAFAIADDLAPLIFVNGNDSEEEKALSLLYAFAHLCTGDNCLCNSRSFCRQTRECKEMICEATATELLIPESLFAIGWKELADVLDMDQIMDCMAAEFRCSKILIASQALEQGLTDDLQFKKIVQCEMRRLDKREADRPGNSGSNDIAKTIIDRMDHRFLRMLVSSVEAGETLYTDAFRLANTDRFTFHELAEQLEREGIR